MKFSKYLDMTKTKPAQFAKAHKMNVVTVWRIYNGKPCNGRIAFAIRAATDGAVTLEELLFPATDK